MNPVDDATGKQLLIDPDVVRHTVPYRLHMAYCRVTESIGDPRRIRGTFGERYIGGPLGVALITAIPTYMIWGVVPALADDAPLYSVLLTWSLALVVPPGVFILCLLTFRATNTDVYANRIEQRSFLGVVPLWKTTYERTDISDVACMPAKLWRSRHRIDLVYAVIVKLRDGKEVMLRYDEDKARVDAAVAAIREQLRLQPTTEARAKP